MGPHGDRSSPLADEVIALVERTIQQTPSFGSAARQRGRSRRVNSIIHMNTAACPLVILWTAPHPASECHGAVVVRGHRKGEPSSGRRYHDRRSLMRLVLALSISD
jgi:hypothetical protein